MAHDMPFVRDGVLTLHEAHHDTAIAVDSSAWRAWLAEADVTRFRFEASAGSFTARRERVPGGLYWYAYRRQQGKLRKAYLGRADDVTLARLHAVCAQLAAQPVPDAELPPAASLPTPAQPAHLLATKLYIPSVRPQAVMRPRLMAQLETGLAGKLTLIAAPAGFGKTTLLAAWLRRNDERGTMNDEELEAPFHRSSFIAHRFTVAWVSLDVGDNDPTRFWSYVITALDAIYPGVGSAPLALLQSPQPPPSETILTMLLNEISAASAGVPISKGVLVLDDYHAIEAPAIHQSLAALVDYLPPHLHLVITTRIDPPLHLARWRARGLLTELRAADLRFTPEEAATFLTQVMGLQLSADDVAALETRTEGWIAGLQLAALAMRGRTDLAGFIAAFTGSNHFVMDYLVQEVLEQLPAHLRTFILQTSILGRLCGSLCDAVLGPTDDRRPKTDDQRPTTGDHTDVDPMFVVSRSSLVVSHSQHMLEELDRRHLFVVALDDVRGWYRYHHLFADLAQAELRRGAPQAQVAALHRRASLWFHEHTLPDEAIQHGIHASDMALAAMLVEHYAQSSLDNASLRVQGWLAQLPAEVVQAHPRLAIYLVRSLTHVGRYEEAIRLLDTAPALAAPNLPPDVVAYIALMRARYDRLFGNSTHFPALLQEAHAKAPPDDVRLQAAIALEECLIAVYTDDAFQAQTRVAEAIRRCNAAELHAPRLLAQFLGASVSGTSFFAIQPVEMASVTSVRFQAGAQNLGSDTTPTDGFQVFLDAATLPAGALRLTATASGPSGTTSKTVDVTIVPNPPTSAAVATSGATLGTTSGGTTIVPAGAVGGSTTVTIQDKTQDQVKAERGIDWAALGVTFLGAIDVQSAGPLAKPLGVSSVGFGTRIQPGQAVVTYQIAPDSDGDGKGELVVVNGANLAPNGTIVSSPISQLAVVDISTRTRSSAIGLA